MTTAADEPSDARAAPPPDIDSLKRKWAIHAPQDLPSRLAKLGTGNHLVKDLIPDRSLSILVGDSGLGKTPLLFQFGLSVAAGVPFLAHPVQQGRVLYFDFENGLAEVVELITQLSRHLGLSEPPGDFLIWNVHDCSPIWGTKDHTYRELILDLKPKLVLIDPLSALRPDIEEKNSVAVDTFQQFRALIRQAGCSILCAHHLKKPPEQSGEGKQPPLGEGNLREWFLRTRGARALINGADVRLGVDEPSLVGWEYTGQQELALVMAGFARLRGEIPLIHLARVFDSENERPLGYKRLTGPELLGNPEQQAAFQKLPAEFRFGAAKQVYNRGSQATTDFLRKAIAAGILVRTGGGYAKV